MALNRYSLVLAATLVTAGTATFGVYRVIENARAQNRVLLRHVVVARKDIPEGAALTHSALVVNEWPVATVPPANVEVKLVVERALAQIGKPYRLGGAGPRGGFDCSGLVAWVYSTLGVRVPRTTDGQFAYFTPVPREQLQPGDLVFFRLPQAHVGIYVGEGEFVHAPATGRPVERARLDGPWFILSFAGGGRLTDSH